MKWRLSHQFFSPSAACSEPESHTPDMPIHHRPSPGCMIGRKDVHNGPVLSLVGLWHVPALLRLELPGDSVAGIFDPKY